MYLICTKSGDIKAKVDNVAADRILSGVAGKWRERKTATKSMSVYEFTAGMVYGNDRLEVMLYTGDFLVHSSAAGVDTSSFY